MTAELKAALMLDAFEHDYFGYGTHVEDRGNGLVYVEHDDVSLYYDTTTLVAAFDRLEEKDKNEIYLSFLSNWK